MLLRAISRLLLYVIAPLLTYAIVAPHLGVPSLALWETGTSMPRGLYIYSHGMPAEVGETIVLNDPPNWSRSYLMKRVEGVPGQFYCWDESRQAHRLNDRWMPAVTSTARMMGIPTWRDCRLLGPDEYVGYGQGDSYDSRYIGPVRAAEIAGVYRLVYSLDRG